MPQPPAVPSGVPVPGDVLAGKYRIERVLGAGGMGVVLAAWHLVLERRVAIKFLLPEAAALPDAGARFLREARAAAALDGQHIARVLVLLLTAPEQRTSVALAPVILPGGGGALLRSRF